MKAMHWNLSILICLVSLHGCSQTKNPEKLVQYRPDYHKGMHIYQVFCAECHDDGRDGAPSLDDVDDWDWRAMQWSTILKAHATAGFADMPSKGGRRELSDQSISDALYYMQVRIKANED